MVHHSPHSSDRSALEKSQADLIALLKQSLGVILIFVLMLVATGGKPPAWLLSVTFLLAGGFVFWAEAKRDRQLYRRRSFMALEPEQTQIQGNQSQPEQDKISESKSSIAEPNVPIFYLQSGAIEKWNRWRRESEQEDINLSGANLSGANLSGADLSLADLSLASLSGADLSLADFSLASLIAANLSGANLSDASLRDADLSDASLSGANLSLADLSLANLSRVSLIAANLSLASLIAANLSGANLSGANLSGANLSGANLSGANLSLADLSLADFSDADLIDAKVDEALFINNSGLTDVDKDNLRSRGAIIQDSPGDTARGYIG